MFSSKTDEWSTPQDLFDKLNDEFHFTLDVCANKSNHKCDLYYDRKQYGLKMPWSGYVVWCNPPYGKEIGKWVKAAYLEHIAHGTTIVMLLPARTDTRWFHHYVLGQAAIRFLQGRLKFGDSKNSAPFPSMLAVYDNKSYRNRLNILKYTDYE